MYKAQPIKRRPHSTRQTRKILLQLEPLETRALPALVWPTPLQAVLELNPHGVLDQAVQLPVAWVAGANQQPAGAQAAVAGIIGNGPAGNADVDWYHFTLDRASQVTLGTFSQQQGTVLSLYNTDATDGSDQYDPLGHRLLVQMDEPAAGNQDNPPIVRDLAAGDYYVAVSGAGNRYFNPFIMGSGFAGATGAYRLLFRASDLQIASTDLPKVLAFDVAPDPVGFSGSGSFARSPLLIRVDLSGAIDPTNLNVQVISSGASGTTNLVAGVAFSSVANELRVSLTQALAPGSYQVLVSATDTNGAPLLAADALSSFQVTGIEGNTGQNAAADNTPATAHELAVAGGGLVQVAGAIGDNPTSAVAFDPNNVDVYHFQITGSGNYALTAEAFAGRIGSPLNPALSLFEDVAGQLHLITLNSGTFNLEAASAGSPVANPLQSDAALYAGLQAGDYYLTVSANGNTPDPFGGDIPFDPNAPLGPTFGGFAFQGGAYVLNVQVQQDDTSPQVSGVTGLGPQSLTGPPAQFVVKFTELVNLQQQAFATQQYTLSSVFILGADGTSYSPKLVSYNVATNEATFQMVDRLAPGAYTLHLSGMDPATAIKDIAGNPLVGNDASGASTDYEVNFVVAGAGHGTTWQETANDELHPQDLGVLAPFDLTGGITITGQFSSEGADFYHLQVLQNRQFVLTLQALTGGSSLPAGSWVNLENTTTGQPVPLFLQRLIVDPNSQVDATGEIHALVFMQAGADYVIRVNSWAAGAAYQLQLANSFSNESPPPLTVGAAPAIRIRLLDNGGSNPPPVLTPPVLPPSADPPTSGNGDSGTSAPAQDPSASTIPASVFLALTAGPMGSVNNPTGNHGPAAPDVFDQVFAHAPSPVLSDGIVRLAILSVQTSSVIDADAARPIDAEAGPSPPALGLLENLLNLWNGLPLGPALSSEAGPTDDGSSESSLLDDPQDSARRDTDSWLRLLDTDAMSALAETQHAPRLKTWQTAEATTGSVDRVLAISLFFTSWAGGLEASEVRETRQGRMRRPGWRHFDAIN